MPPKLIRRRPSAKWWPDWRYGDGLFIWPVDGPVSQYAHAGHWALDIAVPEGTQVKAADRPNLPPLATLPIMRSGVWPSRLAESASK